MPKGASASAFQLKYSQYSIDFFLSCTLGIIRAKKYLFACYNKIISSRIFLKGYRLIMGLQSDKSTETSNDPPVDSAPQPVPVKTVHRLGQRASRFASVLVVALLGIASLLLFRHYSTAIVMNIPTANPAG